MAHYWADSAFGCSRIVGKAIGLPEEGCWAFDPGTNIEQTFVFGQGWAKVLLTDLDLIHARTTFGEPPTLMVVEDNKTVGVYERAPGSYTTKEIQGGTLIGIVQRRSKRQEGAFDPTRNLERAYVLGSAADGEWVHIRLTIAKAATLSHQLLKNNWIAIQDRLGIPDNS